MIDLLKWALNGLLEHVESGRITVPLLIIIGVMIVPTLWGLYTRYYMLRKIEGLYIARISDKDSQIRSLNRRILALEKKLTGGDLPEKE